MRSAIAISSITCISLMACSVIFKSDGDGNGDGGNLGNDANTDNPCSTTQPLDPTPGFSLKAGQTVDINGDGLDEVILVADPLVGEPRVLIHDGRCPQSQPWSYQFEWMPADNNGNVLEAFVLESLPRRFEGGRFVALIGEQSGTPFLGTFALESSGDEPIRISSMASFRWQLPRHKGSDACEEPKAPYSIVAADLDGDTAGDRDDLIFASNQDWIYQVADWRNPPAWDAECVSNAETGEIPKQNSGPGIRFGFSLLPPNGENGDEVIIARNSIIDWIFDFTEGRESFPWTPGIPDDRVDGVAMGHEVQADDGLIDLVGWMNPPDVSNTVTLYAATLKSDGGRSVEERELTMELGNAAPTSGHLLAGGGHLLLLVESTLYLIDLGGTGTLDSQADLTYSPRFFLVPDQGDGPAKILFFRTDDGAHECFTLESSGLVPCP